MRTSIIPEDSADPNDPSIGGKARGLARLRANGFDVPPWLCIPSSITDDVLHASREDLEIATAAIGDGIFAVRSSALAEDGANSSFAGQFETFLNVPQQDVLQRVFDVRSSASSSRLDAYRAARGASADNGVAVIVQRMLAPEAAGVAFTRDPLKGDDVVIVSAVQGLGDSLASGDANADTWRVASTGAVLSREGPSVLLESRALAVAKLARQIESSFGSPQDIEWAISGDRIFVLQARPITALEGETTIWDNSNIAESYGGVNSTLTFSFARYAYAKAYRRMLEMLKVSSQQIESHSDAFENLLGLIQSRMYYNLLNWYRLLSLLPGFRFNRKFMEQMMGTTESLSPQHSSHVRRISSAVSLARSLCALTWQYLVLPRRVTEFRQRFDQTLDSGIDLQHATTEAIVDEFRRLETRLADSWDAPLLNDFFTMIFFGALGALCRRWCSDQSGTIQNIVVADCGGLASVEPATLVRRIANSATGDPAFIDLLSNAGRPEIENALRSRPEKQMIHEYVARFGDRCEGELKLESITLSMDPLPLYRSIARAARSKAVERVPNSQSAVDDIIRAHFRGRPIHRVVFLWVLRNARARISDRETLRFDRTRLFARVREIFRELGARASRAELLDDPDDVFHLEITEALEIFDGSQKDIRSRVVARKEQLSKDALKPSLPHRITMRGGRIVSFGQSAEQLQTGDSRKGIGCCAGIVTGTVCVVKDPAEPFGSGEILVTERTDPSWVMLFPAASGILVERGSLLSHAAIVSREMGIPSVVAIDGLTSWLKTGDSVEFDGATGIVRRIETA